MDASELPKAPQIFQTAPEKSKRVFFGGWDRSLGTKRSFYSYFLVVGCSISFKECKSGVSYCTVPWSVKQYGGKFDDPT